MNGENYQMLFLTFRKLQQLHVCYNQNIDGGLEPMREEKAGLCEPVMGEKYNSLSAGVEYVTN